MFPDTLFQRHIIAVLLSPLVALVSVVSSDSSGGEGAYTSSMLGSGALGIPCMVRVQSSCNHSKLEVGLGSLGVEKGLKGVRITVCFWVSGNRVFNCVILTRSSSFKTF